MMISLGEQRQSPVFKTSVEALLVSSLLCHLNILPNNLASALQPVLQVEPCEHLHLSAGFSSIPGSKLVFQA